MTDTSPTPTPTGANALTAAVEAGYLKTMVSVRPSLGAELHDALTSRKLWALIVGLVTDYFAVAKGRMDLEAAVLSALGLISAYCIAQGIADSKRA